MAICVSIAGGDGGARRGARFDLGGDIIMGREAALQVARLSNGLVVANHLEALDHCPVTRAELREARDRAGLEQRLLVPEDGATLDFGRS